MKPSKRTITTLNRFTIFTQSWLVKANLLFLLLSFFLSCTEDPNTIGFKSADTRFKVYYKELHIPSSVIATDSLVTSNDLSITNETKRLLVGKYTDDAFGTIEAMAFSQFAPNHLSFPKGSVIESVKLNLTFDYYYYGNKTNAIQTFYVHELQDSILSYDKYYHNSKVNYNTTPLGQVTRTISPTAFEESLKNNTDADANNNVIDTLTIPLDNSFGDRLLTFFRTDSVGYRNIHQFKKTFKGFGIRSEGNDKIVGINPNFSSSGLFKSRLIIYVQYPEDPNNSSSAIKRGYVDYDLYYESPTKYARNGVTGFSQIRASREGTELQDVVDHLHKETLTASNLRYIQGGSPIFTKLDLSNFISFSDTLKDMIINSAELTIDPVESQNFSYPQSLALQVLDSRNRFKKSTDAISAFYSGLITSDNYGKWIVGAKNSTGLITDNFRLLLTKKDNGSYKYSVNLSSFFQMMYVYKEDQNKLLWFGLTTASPEMNKSVNRLIFNANNLKLKIYYTLPTTNKNE